MKTVGQQINIGIKAPFEVGIECYTRLEFALSEFYDDEFLRPSFYLHLEEDLNQKDLLPGFLKQIPLDYLVELQPTTDMNEFLSEAIPLCVTRPKKFYRSFKGVRLKGGGSIRKKPIEESSTTAQNENATVLGIIGGMGPLAGASFLDKLFHSMQRRNVNLNALEIRFFSNPSFPPNIKRGVMNLFRKDGRNTFTYMRSLRRFLSDQAVDYYIAPCNTFHRYAPFIDKATGGKLKSIIDIVTEYVQKETATNDSIGLIATNNTVQSHLYEDALLSKGRSLVSPRSAYQMKSQGGIQYVKSGDRNKAKTFFHEVIRYFQDLGIHHIMLGCTEVPLGVDQEEFEDTTFFDTPQILADATISLLMEDVGDLTHHP